MERRSSVFLNSAAISVLRVTSGLPTPVLYAVWIPDSPVSAYVFATFTFKYTLGGEEDSGGVKILVGLYLEHQKDPGPGKCTKLEALSVLTGMRALNRNRPAL